MFELKKKPKYDFGYIDADDDADIEITSPRKDTRKYWWSESFGLIRDIFLILVVFILVGVFAIQPVVVDGSSMYPQLHNGERLLVNKLVYYKWQSVSWGHLERGDIVVFWFPDDPDKSYVKRIIGLPGEMVEIRGGKVYVNNVQLVEDYLDPEMNKTTRNWPAKQVEKHHYYVMGDNRDDSSDSRYWGSVPEKYIYGKAFFRYWQPGKAGFLEHGDYPGLPANADEKVIEGGF